MKGYVLDTTRHDADRPVNERNRYKDLIKGFIQHPHFSSLAPSANHLQINQRILSRQKSNGH